MTFLDPLENAGKVDLLAGKSGGLFSIWDKIKVRPCHKRLVCDFSRRSENVNHDFLKSSSGPVETESVFRPVPSIYETRFHRGFHRRLFPNHDKDRFEIDDRAWRRYERRNDEAARSYEANRRNIVTGLGLPAQKSIGLRRGESLTSMFDSARSREGIKRNVGGDGRFFVQVAKPKRSVVPCETVVIGYQGDRKRNRAASLGIFDNFSHTQASLVEAPRPVNRRNLSQFTFT